MILLVIIDLFKLFVFWHQLYPRYQ